VHIKKLDKIGGIGIYTQVHADIQNIAQHTMCFTNLQVQAAGTSVLLSVPLWMH